MKTATQDHELELVPPENLQHEEEKVQIDSGVCIHYLSGLW